MTDFWNDISSNKGIRIAGVAVLALLALFLLALTVKTVKALGDSGVYPAKTITISGEGEATAKADTARVTFTVQESAADVATAQAAATKRTDDALNAMGEQGVEEKDLKTLSYNVFPQYEQPSCPNGICAPISPRITGYQVTQTVQVKVRDTAMVGEVLQALGDLGVQNISGPEFGLDDDGAVQDEARSAAIEDAREKAKMLAKDLGVNLGKVVSFYEEQGGYPMPMYEGYGGKMMDMAAQSAPSLPAGESETKVRVSVTFEIR